MAALNVELGVGRGATGLVQDVLAGFKPPGQLREEDNDKEDVGKALATRRNARCLLVVQRSMAAFCVVPMRLWRLLFLRAGYVLIVADGEFAATVMVPAGNGWVACKPV